MERRPRLRIQIPVIVDVQVVSHRAGEVLDQQQGDGAIFEHVRVCDHHHETARVTGQGDLRRRVDLARPGAVAIDLHQPVVAQVRERWPEDLDHLLVVHTDVVEDELIDDGRGARAAHGVGIEGRVQRLTRCRGACRPAREEPLAIVIVAHPVGRVVAVTLGWDARSTCHHLGAAVEVRSQHTRRVREVTEILIGHRNRVNDARPRRQVQDAVIVDVQVLAHGRARPVDQQDRKGARLELTVEPSGPPKSPDVGGIERIDSVYDAVVATVTIHDDQ